MAYDERYPLKEYLNSINVNKNNLMDEDSDPAWESNYPSYVINKCMSHHMDTVMYANEMNQYSNISKKMQYEMKSFLKMNSNVKDKFKFIGEVKNINEIYKQVDALIHPSIYEGCLLYTSPSPRDQA